MKKNLQIYLLVGIAPPCLLFAIITALDYLLFNGVCGLGDGAYPCSFYEYYFKSGFAELGLLVYVFLAMMWVTAVFSYLRIPGIFYRPDDPSDKEVTKWKL
jgi:hypothetical protein